MERSKIARENFASLSIFAHRPPKKKEHIPLLELETLASFSLRLGLFSAQLHRTSMAGRYLFCLANRYAGCFKSDEKKRFNKTSYISLPTYLARAPPHIPSLYILLIHYTQILPRAMSHT